MSTTAAPLSFASLPLHPNLLQCLEEIGYTTPSPIQAATIPHLLAGQDVLGQAQTGTGKTAAFALPLLHNIDLEHKAPQIAVLAPTRELAIQVSKAFQKYGTHLAGLRVVPIYGGQSYEPQLKALKKGAHVVVATPGRFMDHIKKGTLDLQALKCFVLDEADEMLRMGFIGDVEWILKKLPSGHQTALFSATMPAPIQKIAERYLHQPKKVAIAAPTATVETISQYCMLVPNAKKKDTLHRLLQTETYEGMIIFVRTKSATQTLADDLNRHGFRCIALSGDVAQNKREASIQRLKKGEVDILIATDVAARGLDVERITHVINYDMPFDTETYIHRIGRTGRAGRKGKAILFLTSNEKKLLKALEKRTKQRVTFLDVPSAATVSHHRLLRFKEQLTTALKNPKIAYYRTALAEYQEACGADPLDMAAALALLNQQASTPTLQEDAAPSPSKKRHAPRKRFGPRRK